MWPPSEFGKKRSGFTYRVAHPAHGVDQGRSARRGELAAQVADVDREVLGGGTDDVAPDARGPRGVVEYDALVADHQLQQDELGLGQRHLRVRPPDPPGG